MQEISKGYLHHLRTSFAFEICSVFIWKGDNWKVFWKEQACTPISAETKLRSFVFLKVRTLPDTANLCTDEKIIEHKHKHGKYDIVKNQNYYPLVLRWFKICITTRKQI